MEENNSKQPFMLLPTIESRIITGILSFTGIIILFAWVAINENARMEEFTERFEGRSIENGAILFENNCSTCHGQLGYGQAGVAPALNNPHFFSYDFFAEYDQQINIAQARLDSGELTEEEAAELEAEIAALERARLELEEELMYDYGDVADALQAELAALDAEIIERFGEEYGVVSAALLGTAVTNLENQIAELEAELQTTTDADRVDEITAELETLNAALSELSDYNSRRTTLAARSNRYNALKSAHEDVQSIRAQIDAIQAELQSLPEPPEEGIDPDGARRNELQAQLDELENQLRDAEDARDAAREDLILNNDIVAPFDPERYANGRLAELNWGGTLESLIVTTLISGRPTSGSYWPQGMAAWSQEAGGPLRRDQIQNLADYILNWDKEEWTVEDVRRVQQYAKIPVDAASATASEVEPICSVSDCDDISSVVADLEALMENMGEAPEGEDAMTVWDPIAGQAAYTSATYGCSGCHVVGGGGSGPSPEGLYTRAQQYAEENDNIESARYYIVESIIHPNNFIAPGYQGNIMPANFGDRIDIATFSNIVAYLETQDQ
ncbi:MAG: hypothetical protein CUN55_05885 [Phototrophicales bacterium]|nr:MAG: hypothetical protein CUN55_05885 [Phototrophicales bacterium]